MKNESAYRISVLILLAGILAVQIIGLLRTPHTKKGLPEVSVSGIVSTDLTEPIQVQIVPSN